ncbi:TPM domain-containing protein [Pseudoflavitalea sp. G-6-1-2]|uniref:TPM domain-containing protein n=1 Tax=Pseudoflavitalea sp. G-6-1-2 TaxID=2728841 RepID=UPI00146E449F|nr:TPM domain-containing protein [Pseudoflavitalea sp. G-6-1-2]NML24014.1 TPM domain-containing protein [Pseudoflavitalea sp. G-6-1-2]
MKSILALFVLLMGAICTRAQDLDVIISTMPDKRVNDYAKVLSKDAAAKLEAKLVAFDNKTTTQIAILLVDSLEGRNLDETANAILNTWGIGQKGKNNGILIFAAIKDRKIRIEIGDGLVEAIPNIKAADIIKKDIVPYFKEKKYFTGLNKATTSLMKLAIKTFPPKKEAASKVRSN